jgi:DNA-binding transcriptional regulator LsrR (DeoR family)
MRVLTRSKSALDDRAPILEVARLFFEKRRTQQQIAKQMGVEQSTVSRWITAAKDQGIVTFHIETTPEEELEERMKEILLPRGIRTIAIVPRSRHDPKNVDNLGDRGALAIFDAIENSPNKNVSVVLSCGVTIRTTIFNMVDMIRMDKTKRDILASKDSIDIYPSTLWGDYDYRLKAAYPHTLVTLAYVHLAQFVDNINAYAPILHGGFFALERSERSAFLTENHIDKILKCAREADIIVTGLGTTGDPTFSSIHKDLHTRLHMTELPINTPEICYQPVGYDGALADSGYSEVVGLSLNDLRMATKNENRSVIAIGGGQQKKRAITQLLRLREPLFNAIVTDDLVAEEFLSTEEA